MSQKYRPDGESVYSRLWAIERKLKGMGYLISSCNTDGASSLGDDEDVYPGIGAVFLDAARDIGRIWRELENDEIKAARKAALEK